MLSLDTAYRSFGGEVEASSTPTICRLSDSRRHQLSAIAPALDAVSMQLKWKHQFQFAGYYQALEQGFYRDAGLDVTIREGGPDIDVSEAVAGGRANFGVCGASVLREWTM